VRILFGTICELIWSYLFQRKLGERIEPERPEHPPHGPKLPKPQAPTPCIPKRLGSERVRSNVSGGVAESFAYLPFGDPVGTQGVSPLHFSGDERDSESALDHTWFRQYSSAQGRWLTPDPLGLASFDLSNPQSLNLYAYVLDNPVNLMDPLGLKDCYSGRDSTGEPILVPCPFPDPTGPLGGCRAVYLDQVFIGSIGYSCPSRLGDEYISDRRLAKLEELFDKAMNRKPKPDLAIPPNAKKIFDQVGRTAPQVTHPCTILGFYAASAAAPVIAATYTAQGAALFPELAAGVLNLGVRLGPGIAFAQRVQQLTQRALVTAAGAVLSGCNAF